jgi:hypothetical protein
MCDVPQTRVPPPHNQYRHAVALIITSFAWLPSKSRGKPRRPCDSMTMRSHLRVIATLRIPSAGNRSTTHIGLHITPQEAASEHACRGSCSWRCASVHGFTDSPGSVGALLTGRRVRCMCFARTVRLIRSWSPTFTAMIRLPSVVTHHPIFRANPHGRRSFFSHLHGANLAHTTRTTFRAN